MKNKRYIGSLRCEFILIICFFSFFSALLYSQDNSAQTRSEESLSSEKQRIEMEIKISTLPELAALCRTLGLPESGTREDLSRRLREHFELPEATAPSEGQKTITVESAQTSEYFRIDVIDEEYARLTGDVKLSMKDGDDIHTISAQEVLFNRTRNILTAKGNVVYIKTTDTDGTVETFRGENITVNIDNWSSTFLSGDSEHKLASDETTYRFSGSVISRTGDDVTIINNAVITNSATEEPYWSITASKLWLLPGSDFALFNMLLKVGEIPVFYFPFFYYPTDELIFHPVFGTRSREGAFVQTTTYLLGRPKSDPEEQNSITKILGGAPDMDKERHGIFLRSTGKKTVNPNETSLRLLVDHYVNMGTFAGFDLSLPRKGVITQPVDFSLGLGYTRTISQQNSYNPYAPGYDGEFDWNHSNFFSNSVPFRYKMHFKSAIGFRYGSLSWDFPYYSDPYVNRDFYDNRTESMDWFSIMQEGLTDTSPLSSSALGAPQWNLYGNINPSVKALNPYVSRFSISSLSTSLTFRDRQNNTISDDSPTRRFFVPETYTIYNMSTSIGGTLFSTSGSSQNTSSENVSHFENPLAGIGEPISPWTTEEETSGRNTTDDIIAPPVLNQTFTLPRAGDVKFDIDYSITPNSYTELRFMQDNWDTPEDVDWNDVQSILTSVSGTTNINFRANHSSGLFANTITLSGLGTWKDFTYINEEAQLYNTTEKIDTAKQQQYSYTRYSSSYEYTGTVRPLLNDPIFGQSNLRYNFRGTLVNSKRYDKINSPDGPELTPVWGSWVKEKANDDIYGLNRHSFSSSISALLFDKQQSLTLSADLPPLDPSISTNATFNVWYSSTSISFRMKRNAEDAPEKPGEWIYDPINFTETLKFNNNNTFVYHMIVKPEEDYDITSINSNLTLWNSSFRTAFTASKTRKVRFDPDERRWVENLIDDPVLQPQKLSFSYNRNLPNMELIKNSLNLTFTIGTSLTYDLLRHTNSSFEIGLTTNIKVTNFMDIMLRASSNNFVIFRYFKNVPGMDYYTRMYPEGPQNNPFTDLIDSFNFFDDTKRKRSGFKMGTFDIEIKHYLGDWEAKLEIKMYPYLDPAVLTRPDPTYKVVTDIGFIVQWKPISEIKTDIKYEGQHDRWSSQ